MSFAETHKQWLLPTLGVACAGVLWLNWPASGSVPAAPALAAEPVDNEEPQEEPEAALPPGTDLRALEAPPPEANATAQLLAAGRHALGEGFQSPPHPPVLHPALWPTFPSARSPKALTPAAPPSPDFVIDRGEGPVAWSQGRPQRREAQPLPPGSSHPTNRPTERP